MIDSWRSMNVTEQKLPDILVGPILRKASADQLTFWLATTKQLRWRLGVFQENQCIERIELTDDLCFELQLGDRLYIYLLQFRPEQPLPTAIWLGYELDYRSADRWVNFQDWAKDLLYRDEVNARFRIATKLTGILHGSCRKPHHPSPDGLIRADSWVQSHYQDANRWPDLLMLSGDQVYSDDVAGPFLVACHQLAGKLGLFDEQLPDTSIYGIEALTQDERCYYRRSELLPDTAAGDLVKKRFFEGKRKPIFTTDSAQNHLITAAEVFAAYLLIWSPNCWKLVDLKAPDKLLPPHQEKFDRELDTILTFSQGLRSCARLLAHIPTYMIWDDHDITDDWNLSAGWEKAAYANPLSRRIIGNALFGYLIFQGLGNDPEKLLGEFSGLLQSWSSSPAEAEQEALIDYLFKRSYWGYEIPLDPGIIVLDTRTQRWRSESDPNKPSGLMDWESLVDLQQGLLDRKVVVLVSPAPVFGVKLIETIQKIFTWFGKPLMVDAENWMAHRGSANVILNIFLHSRTPERFIILSGDVHYSFVYDIEIRFRQGGPKIHQITSSGIKNEFPEQLLSILDRLNRWLYAPWSPLNWFTKRRLMRVRPRRPTPATPGRRLVNRSGIGWVSFSQEGKPEEIFQLGSNGIDTAFKLSEEEEHWS